MLAYDCYQQSTFNKSKQYMNLLLGIGQVNIPIGFNSFFCAKKMIPNINMLDSFMLNLILSQVNCTNTIKKIAFLRGIPISAIRPCVILIDKPNTRCTFKVPRNMFHHPPMILSRINHIRTRQTNCLRKVYHCIHQTPTALV